ncbi:hypothetical protein HD554DRAFT_2118247 [Boletus coccyginus]|nr:hypothetical protein HD554DRAFT_2118247 [Boletus coccyginus]
MRRGFLNTEKAKLKPAADTDAPSGHSLHIDKGKEKAESPADATKPCPPLLDLHSVPPSMKTLLNYPASKNRFVFRHWPRDPNGKPILRSDIHGKEAGNGLDLWGATLYDFYFVRRMPDVVHAATISTGSKLTQVMKALGELEYAQSEIAWAAREADPKEIPGWDPAQATVIDERRVHIAFGVVDKTGKKSSAPPETSAAEPKADVQMPDVSEPVAGEGTEPRKDVVEVAEEPAPEEGPEDPTDKPADSVEKVTIRELPSDIPVESPFHPSHYPSPWPLVPFESPCSPFSLQRRIPIHLLPKKLHVHDPWKLVNVDLYRDTESETFREGEESWTSKTDHVVTYTLTLRPESQIMAEAASKAAAAIEDEAPPEAVFILSPQETEGPTEQPAIRAFLPKLPRNLTEVPEAHLYLSPKGRLGTGHHSIVYEAELEIPRDLFCESTYCKSCLDEQIKVEVDRLKESGEWEERLNEAAKTYKGPGAQDAASRHSSSSSSAQIPPRYVGFVGVKLEHLPMETVDMVAATTFGETPPADAPSQHFARVSDSVTNRYMHYQGLIVPVYPNIQWQNPSFPDTICRHNVRKTKPVPRTARFRVAAKLSVPGDRHLEREANNYLEFPAHFFQHWTGYNVIPPLHDPTPLGAVVPQFFGYYTPDTPSGSDCENEYFSPILLIEHCGKPIRANKLSIDDCIECAALLFRFHSAGWLHESFAERNILMQNHHPTCSPLEEEDKCDLIPHRQRRHSFRLIDFGRSVKYECPLKRASEESEAEFLFSRLQ